MSDGNAKGNNPERWEKLLMALDEKLQLGLLDRLRRVKTYNFEDNILTIEPNSADDNEYLSKEPFFHQLEILAKDALGVDGVRIKQQEA